MHIQYGHLKGKKIDTPQGARLVKARVKKAVFETLREVIPGASVLDLFAGSGALGIESISLGAERAVFVENDRKAASLERKNVQGLGIDDCSEVLLLDAFEAIPLLYRRKDLFDIVYLDPPYHQGLVRKSLQWIGEYDIVTHSGFVIGFSFSKDAAEYEDIPRGALKKVLSRQYGDTYVVILEHR